MAANINVDWSVLESKGTEIEKQATHLRNSVDGIQKEVRNLKDTWQSDASDSMLAKMNAMTTTFNRSEEVVKEYAKFLKDTAHTYSETEGNITKASNSLEFK